MEEYYGLKALATRMGVSVSTIRRWIKKRGFPASKVHAYKKNGKWIRDFSKDN